MGFFDAFGVDLFKLAAQILNFLLLIYLLNRFAFKPLLRMIDERQATISQGLKDAEQAKRDRQLARAEREAAVDEARNEAQAMIARATKIAEDSRAETVAQARVEAERVTQRAREEIEAEKERAIREIRTEVADLAILAAGRLLHEEIDGPRQRRLVQDFLAEVEPTRPAGSSS
ncbi:MAG: F0F1 ATP synthase subunit B [Candidatus Limnocylindria bacterium]